MNRDGNGGRQATGERGAPSLPPSGGRGETPRGAREGTPPLLAGDANGAGPAPAEVAMLQPVIVRRRRRPPERTWHRHGETLSDLEARPSPSRVGSESRSVLRDRGERLGLGETGRREKRPNLT